MLMLEQPRRDREDARSFERRRHRRLRGARLRPRRARGRTARRSSSPSRWRSQRDPASPDARLRRLPASLSRRISGTRRFSSTPTAPAPCAGVAAGRRQSDRPSHLPEGLHRRCATCMSSSIGVTAPAPTAATSRSWNRSAFRDRFGVMRLRSTGEARWRSRLALRGRRPRARSRRCIEQNGIASQRHGAAAGGAAGCRSAQP